MSQILLVRIYLEVWIIKVQKSFVRIQKSSTVAEKSVTDFSQEWEPKCTQFKFLGQDISTIYKMLVLDFDNFDFLEFYRHLCRDFQSNFNGPKFDF